MKIKVLSFNIHKGLSPFNRLFSLEEIKSVIISESPDLVFLQEVTGENIKHEKKFDNWPTEKHYEFLADSIWTYYSYAHNAVYPHGHHGNLVLSKYPISHWANYDISTNFLESRGLLMAEIEVIISPERKLTLNTFNTHLNLLQIGRNKQFQRIKDEIKKLNDPNAPLILAGDFNDWNSKAITYFEKNLQIKEVFQELEGKVPKTFPSPFPLISLDRIFYRNLKLQNCYLLKSEGAKKM
ncbi:MAG: endonuclease/exonuclease/phosphatase family protein, partial [Bdellovibrionales bacterium]|nr:endonuclease/exonuclease/phosphatase family protein [Bdellovibrionales bacterium]